MFHIERAFVAMLLAVALIACSQTPDQNTLSELPTPNVVNTATAPPVATNTSTPTEPPPTEPPTIEPAMQIVVATDDSTEQRLIGQLIVSLLNAKGLPVVDQVGMGDAQTVRMALEKGEIDLALALTGLTLTEFQNIPPASLPTEAERSYQLAKTLDEPNRLIWLESADYNATPVVLVRDVLSESGIRNLEDLAQAANERRLKLCLPDTFTDVQLRGLQDTYALNIAAEDVVFSSAEAVLSSLREGTCDAGLGQITDGRIDAWNLSIVLDNLGYFPINNPAPVVRAAVLDAYPELETLMRDLFDGLSGRVVQTLSAQVAVGADGEPTTGDERSINLVAQRYLERAGLLGELPAVTIGITNDPTERLLGLLLAFELLENGFDVEERTYADVTLLRNAVVQGDVDIAWADSAYALSAYHNIPQSALPDDADATYRLAQSLDLQYHNLSWQQPAIFNAGNSMFTALPSLATIDDVAAALESGENLRLCLATGNFETLLEDWAQLYTSGFSAESLTIVEPDTVLPTVGRGECDLGISSTTNPQAIQFELKRLADTQDYLRKTNSVPIVRQDTLAQHPKIAAIASSISGILSEETFLAMRTQIALGADNTPDSGDEQEIATIVQNFLLDTRVLRDRPTIVIGVQNFTETLLLAEMTKQLFEAAGFDAVETLPLGDTVNDQFTALESEIVDITWVYVGAALQVTHGQAESIGDPTLAWQRVSQLDQDAIYHWLQPSAFNNTFTLLVNPSREIPNAQLTTIEELADYMNANSSPLSICVEEDFFRRPDGLQALQVAYEFEFVPNLIRVVEFDELYPMLAAGECDIAEGFRTDGRVEADRFRSLADTKNFFPAYNAAPVIQTSLATAYPNLVQSLEALAANLTDETMVELNALIDFGTDALPLSGDEESIETVAELFLCEQGLIPSQCSASTRMRTIVASPPENRSASCQQLDVNGGFERMRIWQIPNTRVLAKYSNEAAHSGAMSMRMGLAIDQVETHTIVEQTVSLPDEANSAEISFWYLPQSDDQFGGDLIALQLYDTAITAPYETHRLQLVNDGEWLNATFDLTNYIGERFELYFVVVNDGDERPTLVYLDDIEIKVCR